MNAFVEECRREWRRLGVPDGLAEEMATELESDLAEAETDGVSTAEMLGESDPRRFAATWARERGLVPEQPAQTSRRRRWALWLVAGLVVLFFVLAAVAWLGLQTLGTSHSSARHGTSSQVVPLSRAPHIVVPNLVGERKRAALASARAAGLAPEVRIASRQGPAGTVVEQQPAPGTRLRRGSTVRLVVARG
jgi:hypothetical protein